MNSKKGLFHDPEMRKVIGAGMLGNALELYDYTIYAFFASILATLFFPSDDPVTSLIATYGVYASGFLLRPIGGLLFGTIGDRYGRKKALEFSILLMAVPTLCMGLLPTYYQIGILAPILLVAMRMLQGVSVGGELVGSYTFLIEHADEDQKGFAGGWCLTGCFGGKWIGTLIAMLMTLFIVPSVLENWGWRIPFIGSIVLTAAGFYLRRHVAETPTFKSLQSHHSISKSPIRDAIKAFSADIIKCIAAFVIHTASLHCIFVYFPIYLKSVVGFSLTESLLSNLAALSLCMVLMPLSGKLSDRLGRRPILLWGTISLTLLIYPAFTIIAQGNIYTAIPTHLLLAAFFALMHGPFPAMMIELFPAQSRYTASAIAYNLSVGIFGGTTPMISTWLVSYFDSPLAPALWLVCSGLISIAGILTIKETNPQVYAKAFS